jgi:hypothetical protein
MLKLKTLTLIAATTQCLSFIVGLSGFFEMLAHTGGDKTGFVIGTSIRLIAQAALIAFLFALALRQK